jgi:hypothetical protein
MFKRKEVGRKVMRVRKPWSCELCVGSSRIVVDAPTEPEWFNCLSKCLMWGMPYFEKQQATYFWSGS